MSDLSDIKLPGMPQRRADAATSFLAARGIRTAVVPSPEATVTLYFKASLDTLAALNAHLGVSDA